MKDGTVMGITMVGILKRVINLNLNNVDNLDKTTVVFRTLQNIS